MGRPRKITSVKQLEEAREAYKEECDNQLVLTHDFSSKNSEFVCVCKELKRSIQSKRRISEALLQDARISAVDSFEFEIGRGKLLVNFTVRTMLLIRLRHGLTQRMIITKLFSQILI